MFRFTRMYRKTIIMQNIFVKNYYLNCLLIFIFLVSCTERDSLGKLTNPCNWEIILKYISQQLASVQIKNLQLPYDPRGQEYALYSTFYEFGDTFSNVEKFYEEYPYFKGECRPFGPDQKKRKLVNMQVDYINPKPNTIVLGFSQRVIIILIVHLKNPSSQTLFVLGSDFMIYSFHMKKDAPHCETTEELLGKEINSIAEISTLKKTEGCPDLWRKTIRNNYYHKQLSNEQKQELLEEFK